MLGVNNKIIRMMSTSSVSLVDFEQVNVCRYVITNLPDDCRSALKMFYIKCCQHPSDFYWHNTLMYNPFLNGTN